jgi:hypothetical protein
MSGEIVTIARFRDVVQAQLARGRLESAGIPCFLADENIHRITGQFSFVFGGIRLLVRQEDSEEALEIIGEDSAESEREAPQCPQCGAAASFIVEENRFCCPVCGTWLSK